MRRLAINFVRSLGSCQTLQCDSCFGLRIVLALVIVFILTSEILTSESNANLRFFAWHIPVGHTPVCRLMTSSQFSMVQQVWARVRGFDVAAAGAVSNLGAMLHRRCSAGKPVQLSNSPHSSAACIHQPNAAWYAPPLRNMLRRAATCGKVDQDS